MTWRVPGGTDGGQEGCVCRGGSALCAVRAIEPARVRTPASAARVCAGWLVGATERARGATRLQPAGAPGPQTLPRRPSQRAPWPCSTLRSRTRRSSPARSSPASRLASRRQTADGRQTARPRASEPASQRARRCGSHTRRAHTHTHTSPLPRGSQRSWRSVARQPSTVDRRSAGRLAVLRCPAPRVPGARPARVRKPPRASGSAPREVHHTSQSPLPLPLPGPARRS